MPQLFSVEPPGTVQLAAGQSLAEREKGPQRGDVAGLLLLGRREPRRARVAKRKAVVTRSAAGFLHAGNSCAAGFTHASGLPAGYPRAGAAWAGRAHRQRGRRQISKQIL